MPATLSYGVSVFPLWRELILVIVIWAMMLGRQGTPGNKGVSFLLLTLGLMFIREGGRDWRDPLYPVIWLGLGCWGGALLAMIRSTRKMAKSDGKVT